MPDFNKILTPGNPDEGWINAIVDIPQGSSLKIEYDREHGIFMLDRAEPAIFAKPVNYGFIPATKDEDGDELDVRLQLAPDRRREDGAFRGDCSAQAQNQ